MGFRNFDFFKVHDKTVKRRDDPRRTRIVGAIPRGRPQVSRDIRAYANGVCFYQANDGIADF